eukprot:GHVS01025059.1.p1 GENE.GHVS01025059.1~~GHVS01025059.1.p1  ORF type:complete len:281 (+),score=30.12 GHVS01025059.1:544-1386(+)
MSAMRCIKIKKALLRTPNVSQCFQEPIALSECTTECTYDYCGRSVYTSPNCTRQLLVDDRPERGVAQGTAVAQVTAVADENSVVEENNVFEVNNAAEESCIVDAVSVRLDDAAVGAGNSGTVRMQGCGRTSGSMDVGDTPANAAAHGTVDGKRREVKQSSDSWSSRTDGGTTGRVQWSHVQQPEEVHNVVGLRGCDLANLFVVGGQSFFGEQWDDRPTAVHPRGELLWEMNAPHWRWCFGDQRAQQTTSDKVKRSTCSRGLFAEVWKRRKQCLPIREENT